VPGSSGTTPAAERVPIETFEAPKLKHSTSDYPLSERREGGEGWVDLSFMVDPTGKAFEISVMDSSGEKDLEKAAVSSIAKSTFEPGSLNGQPIESAYEMRYKFELIPPQQGARTEFVEAYRKLLVATKAKDKRAADAALKDLKVKNLYEDAYFGLARYEYALNWGDDDEQIEGLRRAIARDGNWHYLPKDLFTSSLRALLQLEVKTHEYAEAMVTWERLQKVGVDPATTTKIAPIMQKVEALRSNDGEYTVSGLTNSDGRWYLWLFKQHFRAETSAGQISEVKLRCKKHYLYFVFDPSLQYEVHDNYGKCQIEIDGTPAMRFTVTQF
jgi:TonB family protein